MVFVVSGVGAQMVLAVSGVGAQVLLAVPVISFFFIEKSS
jgi:hypothetical protein